MRFGGFAFALGVAATSLLACGSGADVYDVEGTSDSGSTVGSGVGSVSATTTGGTTTGAGGMASGTGGMDTGSGGMASGAGGMTAATSGTGMMTSTATTGGGGELGCQKIDFLFVVDNSHSMWNNQLSLISSFPGFMNTIKNTLPVNQDFHVMVTDTDGWGRCNINKSPKACKKSHSVCDDYICNASFGACDMTMGAGVIHPAGKGASNKVCNLQGGKRYIQNSEPDLTYAFSCIAQVGKAGAKKERPMEAMMAAVSPELNAPNGCNEGFLRDDALLVVTFITDEFGNDAGVPLDWYNALVTAKNGDASSVVVIGFSPHKKNAKLVKFVDLWGKSGIHGPVKTSNFDAVFNTAVSKIDEACIDFESPK
mgnify:CR=1 FL=1